MSKITSKSSKKAMYAEIKRLRIELLGEEDCNHAAHQRIRETLEAVREAEAETRHWQDVYMRFRHAMPLKAVRKADARMREREHEAAINIYAPSRTGATS